MQKTNQKNDIFPLSQSLSWRRPADQKAWGLWVRDWVRDWKSLLGRYFIYGNPRFLPPSSGDQTLAKEPEDSRYEIGYESGGHFELKFEGQGKSYFYVFFWCHHGHFWPSYALLDVRLDRMKGFHGNIKRSLTLARIYLQGCILRRLTLIRRSKIFGVGFQTARRTGARSWSLA